MKPGYFLMAEFKDSVRSTYKLGMLKNRLEHSQIPSDMSKIIKEARGDSSGFEGYKKAIDALDPSKEEGRRNLDKIKGIDRKDKPHKILDQELLALYRELKKVARDNLEDNSPDGRSNLLAYMTQEIYPFVAMAQNISEEAKDHSINGVAGVNFKKNLRAEIRDPQAGENIKKYGMERVLMSAAFGIPKDSSDREFELRMKEVISPINRRLKAEVDSKIADDLLKGKEYGKAQRYNEGKGIYYSDSSSRPKGQEALDAIGKKTEIISNDVAGSIKNRVDSAIENKGNVNSNPAFLGNMRQVMLNTIILKKAVEEKKQGNLSKVIHQRSKEINQATGLEGKELYDRVLGEIARNPEYSPSKLFPDVASEVMDQAASINIDAEAKLMMESVTGHHVLANTDSRSKYKDAETLEVIKLYEIYFPPEKPLIERIKDTASKMDPKDVKNTLSIQNGRMNAFTASLFGADPKSDISEWKKSLHQMVGKEAYSQQWRSTSVAGKIMVRDGIVSANELPEKKAPSLGSTPQENNKVSLLARMREGVVNIPSKTIDGVKSGFNNIASKFNGAEPNQESSQAKPDAQTSQKSRSSKVPIPSDEEEKKMRENGTWSSIDQMIKYPENSSGRNPPPSKESPQQQEPSTTSKPQENNKVSLLGRMKDGVASMSSTVTTAIMSVPNKAIDTVKSGFNDIAAKFNVSESSKGASQAKPNAQTAEKSNSSNVAPGNTREKGAAPNNTQEKDDTKKSRGHSDEVEKKMREEGMWSSLDQLVKYGTTNSVPNQDRLVENFVEQQFHDEAKNYRGGKQPSQEINRDQQKEHKREFSNSSDMGM